MTKPISEPTPALESANYGWRIRQLERRPGDLIPWMQVGFSGFYDFAGGSYPTWNWSYATLSSFVTNSATTFSFDSSTIYFPIGIYVANVKWTVHVNGQFLDLPPQAGTTRTYPGHLLSEMRLIVGDGYDLVDYYTWGKEDYNVSAGLNLGLGQFAHELSGFVTAYASTSAYPYIFSKAALIGPNNTGTFPELRPTYFGNVFIARIGHYIEP